MSSGYKIKNSWRNIFLVVLIVVIFFIIGSPLLLRCKWINKSINWYIEPIKNHIGNYLALAGAVLGSVLTISGAMWQSQSLSNEQVKMRQVTALKYIKSDILKNNAIIELIKEFMIKRPTNKEFSVSYHTDNIHRYITDDKGQHFIAVMFSLERESFAENIIDRVLRAEIEQIYDIMFLYNHKDNLTIEEIKELYIDISNLLQKINDTLKQ